MNCRFINYYVDYNLNYKQRFNMALSKSCLKRFLAEKVAILNFNHQYRPFQVNEQD